MSTLALEKYYRNIMNVKLLSKISKIYIEFFFLYALFLFSSIIHK